MKSAYVSKEQFQPLETASTLSLNSLITHSVIHGQERGLTTPAREHFEAYGQVVHGDCSIDLTSTGARSGVSLYVHLPLSSIFSLRIIPRLSSRMASLEPSLLLREVPSREPFARPRPSRAPRRACRLWISNLQQKVH